MTILSGGCHCGQVRYTIAASPRRHSLCYCKSCRRSAGAHVVGWALVSEDALHVTGDVTSYNSSGDIRREFCAACGTGLFFRSASEFPGEVDIRSATLDEPDRLPPTDIIQLDDAPAWIGDLDRLPHHARFPPQA